METHQKYEETNQKCEEIKQQIEILKVIEKAETDQKYEETEQKYKIKSIGKSLENISMKYSEHKETILVNRSNSKNF